MQSTADCAWQICSPNSPLPAGLNFYPNDRMRLFSERGAMPLGFERNWRCTGQHIRRLFDQLRPTLHLFADFHGAFGRKEPEAKSNPRLEITLVLQNSIDFASQQ